MANKVEKSLSIHDKPLSSDHKLDQPTLRVYKRVK